MNNKNIVLPVVKNDHDPVFKALTVSRTHPSSQYNINKNEIKNGFYFEYHGLLVPFKVLLNTNNKTRGIVGVCFGTARDCPSKQLGLCQLPDESLCYARAGEARATRRNNSDGSKGMDSYLNGVLCGVFWDKYARSASLRTRFFEYLEYRGVETIRFNLKGDFRHETDILCIYHLATQGFKLTGYTARDDLAELCEIIGACDNIILNGSNRAYTNYFKATDSIEEYLNASHRCKGSCASCLNCYRLRDEVITVLIHGRGSETALNTPKNHEFLIKNCVNDSGASYFEPEDFLKADELKTCINKTFDNLGLPQVLRFKTTKEFLETVFIHGGAY